MNPTDNENARQPPLEGDDDKPMTASLKAVKSLIHEKPNTMSRYDMTRSLFDSDDDEEEEQTNSRPNLSSSKKDNDDDESLTAASTIVHTNTKHHRSHRRHSMPPSTHKWDDFVRQGTRLKTLFQDAMQHVKSNVLSGDNNKRPRERDDDEESPLRQRRRIEEPDHTADLAREKTAEVILLQRVRAIWKAVPRYFLDTSLIKSLLFYRNSRKLKLMHRLYRQPVNLYAKKQLRHSSVYSAPRKLCALPARMQPRHEAMPMPPKPLLPI